MMDEIKLVKKALRTSMKICLDSVSQAEKEKASLDVLSKLEKLDRWRGAEIVLAFLSMKDELDTAPIIRRAIEQGKKVAVPRVDGSGMVFCQIADIVADTAPGAFGILEPVPGLPEIDIKTLSEHSSVALVPGLAFDRENFRLGRGKGFYDRFLASAGDSLYKIGICYSFQLFERIPKELHDLKMDAVIISGSSAS